MITIGLVIKWEQLMKLPFSKMDNSNIEHLGALAYINSVSQFKDSSYPLFEEWNLIPDDSKAKRNELQKFSNELMYLAQFAPQHEEEAKECKEEDEKGKKVVEDIYIEDIANQLILAGVDASYLMSQPTTILEKLMQALSDKKKEQLENDRLWSYLSILPHISSKNQPSITDFFTFPWEKVEMDKEKEIELEEATAQAKQFFNN